MIRSKMGCVLLNEVSIPEYEVPKSVGPSQPRISINSIQKAFCKIIMWDQKKQNRFGHDHGRYTRWKPNNSSKSKLDRF